MKRVSRLISVQTSSTKRVVNKILLLIVIGRFRKELC